MARRAFADYVVDDAGNVTGNRRIRIYQSGTEVAATAYFHSAAADAFVQPFNVNAGLDTKVRIQPAVGDILLAVDMTVGFAAGDVLMIRSGATTKERMIRVVTDAQTFELVEAIGFAFPVGSAVGSEGMLGHFKCYLDDTLDYEYTVENIATGEISARKQIYTKQLTSTIDIQKEGILVGVRGKVNFIGPFLTVSDNAGNARVDVDEAPLWAFLD